jgi:hypothetical protein
MKHLYTNTARSAAPNIEHTVAATIWPSGIEVVATFHGWGPLLDGLEVGCGYVGFDVVVGAGEGGYRVTDVGSGVGS